MLISSLPASLKRLGNEKKEQLIKQIIDDATADFTKRLTLELTKIANHCETVIVDESGPEGKFIKFVHRIDVRE